MPVPVRETIRKQPRRMCRIVPGLRAAGIRIAREDAMADVVKDAVIYFEIPIPKYIFPDY